MDNVVRLSLKPDGIIIELSLAPEPGYAQIFRRIGQYYFIGASDKAAYPFEVMISVVDRNNRHGIPPELWRNG